MSVFNCINKLNKLCDDFNLSGFSDILILSYLSVFKSGSITEMATTCNTKRQQVNKICARLKEKGYVVSVVASSDKENVKSVFDLIKQIYSLTDKGKEVMKAVNAIFHESR